MNSLLFLPFLDFFWAKRTKNYSCNGEFFQIFIFFLVIGVFLSRIMRVCVFTQITQVLGGDLLTFFTLQACIFYNFYLFGMKMDKKIFCNGECFKILIFI